MTALATLTEVPTLYPTEEEFSDAISFLSSSAVSQLGAQYGMVKLVPPKSFQPPLSINKNRFKFVPRVQKLKELNLLNRCRLFFYKQLLNFNKMKKLATPKDTFETIGPELKKVHYYDIFIEVVKFYQNSTPDRFNGNVLSNLASSIIVNNEKLWSHLSISLEVPIQSLQMLYHLKLKTYFNFLSEHSNFTNALIEEKHQTSLLSDDSSSSSEESSDDEEDDIGCLICRKNNDPSNLLLCDSCDKPFHRYCLSPPLSKIPNDSWYCDNCVIGNGHYGFKDSSFEYSLNDFEDLSNDFDKDFFKSTIKPNVEGLEKHFWDLVSNTDNNVKINYGADIHNLRKGEVSGFPTHDYTPKLNISKDKYKEYVNHSMNLNNLPFDSKSLLNHLNVDISGMTIPWIYVGNTFSTFCWHVEDQYTLSANYQHFGAIKKWYSIPSTSADSFEKYMQSLAPDLFSKQPDILHQLVTLVSPFNLVENNIKCYTANQNPGEYIITYPRVYHAGFNTGFNFNEAVNFTMTDWLDFGILATQNYKRNATKASVFDIWELIMNILKNFTKEDTQSDGGLDVDYKLIEKCLSRLKDRLNDEYSLQATVSNIVQRKPQLYSRKRGTEINYDVTTQRKEEEEDGISCNKCKGFCTFAFVKHYEPLDINTSKKQIQTPTSSPDSDESSNARRSKRIKIKQDDESYDISVLCLDDYLKVRPNINDEYYHLSDINEVKKLINDTQDKLADFRN